MIFFDDMREKYGFSDGDALPAEAFKARDVYIRYLNTQAEKRGSTTRAIAFDRGGSHNPCMVLFISAESCADTAKERLADPAFSNGDRQIDEVEPDAIFDQIIEDAIELDLDQFVDVVVSVNEEGLAELLASLS